MHIHFCKKTHQMSIFFSPGGSNEKYQQYSSAIPLYQTCSLPQLYKVMSTNVFHECWLKRGVVFFFVWVSFFGSYRVLFIYLCQVQDRAACVYQHNPGSHQSLPLQLFLPSLWWLEGRAEPPNPNSRDERWREIPGEKLFCRDTFYFWKALSAHGLTCLKFS